MKRTLVDTLFPFVFCTLVLALAKGVGVVELGWVDVLFPLWLPVLFLGVLFAWIVLACGARRILHHFAMLREARREYPED